jgi:hypothetical protein
VAIDVQVGPHRLHLMAKLAPVFVGGMTVTMPHYWRTEARRRLMRV